jgi:hypothetical protein
MVIIGSFGFVDKVDVCGYALGSTDFCVKSFGEKGFPLSSVENKNFRLPFSVSDIFHVTSE